MNVVIVGASAAGLACLGTLLKFQPEIPITIISEENVPPYSRPLLTYYLGKEMTQAQMTIAEANQYPQNVKFLQGRSVKRIDGSRKEVILSDGETISYDKLLLATGADPIKPGYCDESRNVFTLRYMEDAKKIEKHLNESAVVVGGGFVGIKTAWGLIQRGVKVSLVIASPYPLWLVLDEGTGRFFENALKEIGIRLYTKNEVSKVEKVKKLKVFLHSGTSLEGDVVIVGKGVAPRIELARDSGIETGLGIKVNEYLETTQKDVYAAGDCCETYDSVYRAARVNAIWPNAMDQGYCASLNMLGLRVPYPGSIGMNSIKTQTFHLITAGILWGENIITYEKYVPFRNQFRKIAFRDEVPVGMAFFNAPSEAGMIANLIKKGEPLKINPHKMVAGELSPRDMFEQGIRFFSQSLNERRPL